MVSLFPFRALRPTPDAAARVAVGPYDVVNTDEARSLAAGDPLSFLHMSRPEIDMPPGTDLYSDAVYAKAAANFSTLKARAPLVIEETPGVYVYRRQMARTCRPPSPRAIRWPSTSRTSSGSTNGPCLAQSVLKAKAGGGSDNVGQLPRLMLPSIVPGGESRSA